MIRSWMAPRLAWDFEDWEIGPGRRWLLWDLQRVPARLRDRRGPGSHRVLL